MNVEVHILAFNEAEILPYALRHYKTFAKDIIVHNFHSTDRTSFICQTAEVPFLLHDTNNEMNDNVNKELKSSCWRGTTADWVIVADADELIYFPGGAAATLAAYEARQTAVVVPWGWEMHSWTFPTTPGQLYDEVKHGARDDKWYSKPILFSPRRVRDLRFSAGAHQVTYDDLEGRQHVLQNRDHVFSEPVTYLLHCKHLGPLERIAQAYRERQARHSEVNKVHRYGNFEDPMKHAKDKRDMILAGLTQVIV